MIKLIVEVEIKQEKIPDLMKVIKESSEEIPFELMRITIKTTKN